MFTKKKIEFIAYIILIAAILLSRLPSLDSFVTLDEPYWLSMGANFYYALGQREFQNTVYEYQPAVTTMWIVTAAMLVYFPQYRGLGQGYLEFEKGALDPFMLEHGKDPLTLLRIARLIQIAVILVLFLLLYFLLQRLVSRSIAFFAVLFASFDPFFLGQSRLLDHEAMLSLFVVISLLAFFMYLEQGRRFFFLLLSGISAGLAQLTKSSAIAMLMPIGIILLIQIFQQRQSGFFIAFWDHMKVFIAWLIILAVTYFIFWPGMWVAPGKMLYQVYGNAFSYAFQGARLTVTEELQPSQFSLNSGFSGIWDLIKVFLWRTTPLTWLGILFGFSLPFIRDRELFRPFKQLFTLLLTTAAAFVIIFGLAQGRNSPHYILTSYLSLNLLAGLGWFYGIEWLREHFPALRKESIRYASLSLLIVVQLWSTVLYYPYYFTYRNPILYSAGWHTQFPQFPYGEGLELAAQYLAKLPDAKDSTAIVYYARGSFSYFYPGITTRFKPYYVEAAHKEDLINAIRTADYLVLYYAAQGTADKYQPVLKILSVAQPIHEIWLNDYKYVIIYKIDTLPAEVFEAFAK
jgi:4-amino-4-deoxy-L-arabinose transferase-like glycosyltransferase